MTHIPVFLTEVTKYRAATTSFITSSWVEGTDSSPLGSGPGPLLSSS